MAVHLRTRIFLCDEHRRAFPDAVLMSDADRAELDGRTVRWDAAVAGAPWESAATIDEEDT